MILMMMMGKTMVNPMIMMRIPASLNGMLLKMFQQGASNTANFKLKITTDIMILMILMMILITDIVVVSMVLILVVMIMVMLTLSPVNHAFGGAGCPAAVHDEEGVRERHLGG